jgi:hypothetical protein
MHHFSRNPALPIHRSFHANDTTAQRATRADDERTQRAWWREVEKLQREEAFVRRDREIERREAAAGGGLGADVGASEKGSDAGVKRMSATEAPNASADKQSASRRQAGSGIGEVAASVKNEEEGEEEEEEMEKGSRK